jgi:hypothetical protein
MTGPAFDAQPWNPASVQAAPAGSIAFTFDDADHGVMRWSVDAMSGTKDITRQVFALPASVCR